MAALPLHQPAGAADAPGPGDRTEARRWVLLAGIGYGIGAVAQYVLLAVGVAIAGTKGGVTALANASVPPVWFVVLSFVGLWLGFGAAAVLATRSGRRLGVRVERHDVLYVFLGVALQLALDVAYTLADTNSKGLSKSADHLLGGGPGWLLVLPGFLAVVLAPFFEELFFRGVLLQGLVGALRTRLAAVGVVASVAVDAGLFGLAHVGTDEWVQVPGLAFVGVVLCVLVVRTRRLGPAIITHASFNALAVLAYAWSR